MMWDGLGFFGFDDTKLDRLEGKKLDFLTKFTSTRWTIINIFTMALVIAVLILECRKYGTQMAKEINLVEKDSYNYDIRDAMPLRYVHWFWVAPLFTKVREFQTRHENDTTLF